MIKLYAKCRAGFHADAELYEEPNKKVVVKSGGNVNTTQKEYLSPKGYAGKYRYNKEFVDNNGNILKDCEFKSLSSAGEFVFGDRVNGKLFWKVAPHLTIGKYMKNEEA